MSTILISIAECQAIYAGMPSLTATENGVTTLRRAMTFENQRIGKTSDFNVQFTQRDFITLPNGAEIEVTAPVISKVASEIAGETVIVGGYEIPVLLGQIIIAAAHLKYQTTPSTP